MKELKATVILSQAEATIKISKEESDSEKSKVLYHWLGLLDSLKKLQNAGELIIVLTLEQLTNPAMLEQLNGLLSENLNLLAKDKYIFLCGLLDRELYNNRQLISIETMEIERIMAYYDKIL